MEHTVQSFHLLRLYHPPGIGHCNIHLFFIQIRAQYDASAFRGYEAVFDCVLYQRLDNQFRYQKLLCSFRQIYGIQDFILKADILQSNIRSCILKFPGKGDHVVGIVDRICKQFSQKCRHF